MQATEKTWYIKLFPFAAKILPGNVARFSKRIPSMFLACFAAFSAGNHERAATCTNGIPGIEKSGVCCLVRDLEDVCMCALGLGVGVFRATPARSGSLPSSALGFEPIQKPWRPTPRIPSSSLAHFIPGRLRILRRSGLR